MKIEGFGQLNYTDQIKESQAQTDAAEFESVLKKAFDEGDKKKLKEACDQFEAIMLQMLYKQMKATIPEGGLTEKSTARAMFEDMLDETLMEKSSQRGIGISDMMYRQLSAQMDRTYKIQKPNEDTQLNVDTTEPDKSDPTQLEKEEDGEPEIKPDGAETVED